jgi:uncharacterized membrane protein
MSIFIHDDSRFGGVLLVFYLSSSFATKYKADVKRKLEYEFKEGGQVNFVSHKRDAIQVLSNGVQPLIAGLTGCLLCLLHLALNPRPSSIKDKVITAAYLGYDGFIQATLRAVLETLGRVNLEY